MSQTARPADTQQGDSALGLRIRKYRNRLGISQDVLAPRVGRSKGWLLKVENGRATPGYFDLLNLAAELRVAVIHLLQDADHEQPSEGTDASATSQERRTSAPDPGMMEPESWAVGLTPGEWLEEMRRRAFLRAAATLTGATALGWWPVAPAADAQSQLVALREVLLGHQVRDGAAVPPDLARLGDRVQALWAAFQASRYSDALAMMPELLLEAEQAVRARDGEERRTATALQAQTYQAVSTFLRKLGDLHLAAIAADRAMAAARAHGSAVTLAESARFLSLVLGDTGHHGQAIAVCTTAASRFEAEERHPSQEAWSIYGQLLLAGAEAAAQQGDGALCNGFFDAAAGVGQRLGADANHSYTAFGPTNVHVHRVHAAVVLGDGEGAIRRASQIDTNRLPVLERRAHHLLDVAHGYHLIGKPEEAAVSLLTAEGMAAEEIRYDPLARLLVEQLRQRNRSLSVQLDALAARMPALPN